MVVYSFYSHSRGRNKFMDAYSRGGPAPHFMPESLGVSEYIHVRAWMRQERTTDDSGDTHDDLHTEDHQSVSILDLHCNPPWIAHLQHIC